MNPIRDDWTSPDGTVRLLNGDCVQVLPTLDADSVDAIVTDPPAGISFMQRSWDSDRGGRDQWIAWMTEVAEQCLRVIKPGGHALVWSIPRTSHWTGMAWEEAGWVPRDKVYHCFGSGFPKSLDVSKAIDKAAGAEREVVLVPTKRGNKPEQAGPIALGASGMTDTSEPITDAARQWAGWGTAIKPAIEEWWLFRKPLVGTVAANVLRYGTGGLNVDGTRIGTEESGWNGNPRKAEITGDEREGASLGMFQPDMERKPATQSQGRWPANLVLSYPEDETGPDGKLLPNPGKDEVLALFPETGASSTRPPTGKPKYTGSETDSNAMRASSTLDTTFRGHDDTGGNASRFFYCAKSSSEERGNSKHCTIKPLSLMRYLVRLVTPPNGLILDPFLGSGTTAEAAVLENMRCIGIEQDTEHGYFADAIARVQRQFDRHPLFD